MKSSSFRVIPYFASQYLIYFVIAIAFTIPNQSTSKHLAEERYCSSSNGEAWLDDYNPDYFYHLTDIHVSHYDKTTLENFEKSLQVGASYHPKSILITGDLVDDYYLPYYPIELIEARQIKEDWNEYHKIASKYRQYFDKFIESFGNHDVPRILSPESEEFYYKNYSMISESHHNFESKNETYDIFTDKVGNFTFAVLNPVFFPIPPLPFDYYVHAPAEYIEKVEKVINSIPTNENIILATHYQGPVWSNWYVPFERSTATQRFFDSILQNKKVKILLTGHNHGKQRMVMHYGDSFEVCANDLRYNLKAGLVTNDNGNVVYHWFKIENPTKSFVTFPVPIEQTTSRSDCAVGKIRVISFGSKWNTTDNDINNIYAELDGLKVKLNPVRRLNENKEAWLLEADTGSLSEGTHHIKLLGENEEEFEFLSGRSAKIESQEELLYDDMLWASTQWIGLFILLLCLVFATFPISLCASCSYNGYWRWINCTDDRAHKSDDHITSQEDKEPKISHIKYWLISLFFGPIGIRSRLMRLSLFVRVLLFVSVVTSMFIPLFTFEVGGRYGFMLTFGFFLGIDDGVSSASADVYKSHVYGKYELRYEEWCPFVGFLFFICAIVPTVTVASSFGLFPSNRKGSFLQVFDVLVQVGCCIACLRLSFHSFMLLCERKCALLSSFVLVPLFWMIIFSVMFYLNRSRRVSKID